jgi:hypothetical protein
MVPDREVKYAQKRMQVGFWPGGEEQALQSSVDGGPGKFVSPDVLLSQLRDLQGQASLPKHVVGKPRKKYGQKNEFGQAHITYSQTC